MFALVGSRIVYAVVAVQFSGSPKTGESIGPYRVE
jgi:hypothetical protein